MKLNLTEILFVSIMTIMLCCGPVQAEGKPVDEAPKSGQATQPDTHPANTDNHVAGKARSSPTPVYVPPLRGAPLARVGGGTRGIGDDLPYVSVVTPEHTGFTSTSQPVLYWYLSEPVDTRFEFALINDNEIEPILEIASERAMQKGFNFLDLSEHGVFLKPGIVYQWSVALVGQPDQRSGDIVSSGTIEYVEPDQSLRSALAQAAGNEAIRIYAGKGYWYDAFAGLSRLIEANPADAGLVDQRRSLLQQVGLEAVPGVGR